MARLSCRFGMHKWEITSKEYRLAKVGILAGYIDVEQENCLCGASRRMIHLRSLFGKPRRFSVEKHPEILDDWLPPAELQAWRVARGEERVAAALSVPHSCGAPLRRETVLYTRFTATGQPKEQIGAWCTRCRCFEEHYFIHY